MTCPAGSGREAMRLALLAASALLFAGCATPAADVTPGATAEPIPRVYAPGAGALRVEVLGYDFGVMVATAPDIPEPSPVRLAGTAYLPEGEGEHPVVLLMHGNHFTCSAAGLGLPGAGLCRDTPVTTWEPSHAGYAALANDLASRGFVVLSINANDVNDANRGHDLGANQRAQLFLRTLDELALAHAGEGPLGARLSGKLDLGRVGLMGHSRGGDGAARAVTLDAEGGSPHGIDAVFALAPTDFVRHLVVGVPFATLLPYCDGDVSNLQGAWMFDDARYAEGAGPLHQIVAMGANHNFYNTVWTADDVGANEDDAECGRKASSRASPEAQHLGGTLFMSAFFRRYLQSDLEMDRLLRGDVVLPPEACAASHATCATAFHVSYHPPADSRLLIEDALDDAALTTNDAGGATLLDGWTEAAHCLPEASDQRRRSALETRGIAPPNVAGTCPFEPTTAAAPMLALASDGPAAVRWVLGEPTDGAVFTHFGVRIAREPDAPLANASLRLEDETGRVHEVWLEATVLFDPPGEGYRKVTLNAARAKLPDLGGARLVAVELVFDGPTAIRLADAMLAR